VIKATAGQPAKCIGYWYDITARKGMFRKVAETAATALFIYRGSKLRYVNPMLETMTGYTQDELLAMDFWKLIHPDWQQVFKAHGFAHQRGDGVPRFYEVKLLTKRGEERWLHVRLSTIEFEGTLAGLGTAIDVTEQRRATEALQHSKDELEDRVQERTAALTAANKALQAEIRERVRAEGDNMRLLEQVRQSRQQLQTLSHRLLEIQEAERRRLARELHDEIGQILTGLKLTLEVRIGGGPHAINCHLKAAQTLVNDLIRRVSDLSLDLRPPMLDNLGLLPTLLWHFERYSAQTKVQVDFKHSGLEGRRLQAAVETAVFRMVQEALTNVARHAQVNQVTVCIWSGQDILNVQIEDQGAGFDPQATPAISSGLAGMHERVTGLGGRLTIESAPGSGTCIMAEVPLRGQGERERREHHDSPG
jgi:PAS domain S-box-containing protein